MENKTFHLKLNLPISEEEVPKADLTSPPTPVSESAPVPNDAIMEGWSWPPGVGGAEREEGAPGGSGGDFVDLGDEIVLEKLSRNSNVKSTLASYLTPANKAFNHKRITKVVELLGGW
ncbi:hypothetical protein C0J52_25589 [Blattella germanica]|nr:hypothetical protein C0J52_25589 [Blattella germanica]